MTILTRHKEDFFRLHLNYLYLVWQGLLMGFTDYFRTTKRWSLTGLISNQKPSFRVQKYDKYQSYSVRCVGQTSFNLCELTS